MSPRSFSADALIFSSSASAACFSSGSTSWPSMISSSGVSVKRSLLLFSLGVGFPRPSESNSNERIPKATPLRTLGSTFDLRSHRAARTDRVPTRSRRWLVTSR